MKLPCEKALWYVLPQIRVDLTKELVKSDMSQKEVADILGVTPSAVSQYIHKKRGGKVKMSSDYKKRIRKTAEEIMDSTSEEQTQKLICRCCTASRPKFS